MSSFKNRNIYRNIHYTTYFFVCTYLFLCTPLSAATPIQDGRLTTYAAYQDVLGRVCRLQTPPTGIDPQTLWTSALSTDSLVSTDTRDLYPSIDTDIDIKSFYDTQIAAIPDQKTKDTYKKEIYGQNIASKDIPNVVRMAGATYRRQMNDIYACGVVTSRLRMLGTLQDIPGIRISKNLTERINREKKSLERASIDRSCRQADTTETRKALLDNTMYQYCTYRYYMAYVDTVTKNDISVWAGRENALSKSLWNAEKIVYTSTPEAAIWVDKMSMAVSTEVAKSKKVYTQALAAYTEMERTYLAHILLVVIRDDYIQLRTHLRDLLNPISQIFYKIQNSQSKNPPQ